MQSRGPLMMEHRLIEKMIEVVGQVLKDIEASGKVDPVIVDKVIDFIRVYADRTHHGKEEDCVFDKLKSKDMSTEDKEMMDKLINEHIMGRKTVAELDEANTKYKAGDNDSLKVIIEKLNVLAEFYPKHIEKEDKIFFPAYMKYFTEEEDQKILADFWEFDKMMIHEKYKGLVDELKGS
jgi:hemerythrin-like domain-containing protein